MSNKTSDFLEEDFYRAKPDAGRFVVADGYGNKVFIRDDGDEAERLANALNLAFTRGALRALSVVCTPELLAEAGIV